MRGLAASGRAYWCRESRGDGAAGHIRQRAATRRRQAEPLATTKSSVRPAPSLEEVAEHGDERLVRRRHRVVGEPIGAHPGETLAFARRHAALPLAADIE